jgi:hypothetical protein
MEANKASNVMAHREEILQRPARTWFQSESGKQAARWCIGGMCGRRGLRRYGP